MICCLSVVALVSLLLNSGCQDVFNRLPGVWSFTVTYDRGEFTMDAEFVGDDNSGTVVMAGIAGGEYQVDGENVTFTVTYTHAQLGAATDQFSGTFDSGITMVGDGTVTYHDQNRTEPLTWRAAKKFSYTN